MTKHLQAVGSGEPKQKGCKKERGLGDANWNRGRKESRREWL